MGARNGNTRRPLALLALAILLLTLAVNALSAWIRHAEAGLACADRVSCYGLIGERATPAQAAEVAREAFAPEQPARRLHRVLASALVVMVLILLARSRGQGGLDAFERQAPFAIAGLLLLLAVVGPASYLKTRPAIAACNLLGGMALAALGFRLWLGLREDPRAPGSAGLRRLVRFAFGALLLQLALGAWTSASFAGLACDEWLRCGPDSARLLARESLDAFWYFRELELDGAGRVRGGSGAVAIHLAHRLVAAPCALLLLIAAWHARREGMPRAVVAPVVLLLAVQLSLGLLQVLAVLPLPLVLAHGLNGTLLLLATVRLERCVTAQPVAGRRA